MNIFFSDQTQRKEWKNPAHAMGNLGEKLGLRPPPPKTKIHSYWGKLGHRERVTLGHGKPVTLGHGKRVTLGHGKRT